MILVNLVHMLQKLINKRLVQEINQETPDEREHTMNASFLF